MIVKRHHEIEQFVSTPFWEIKTTYRDTVFSATKGRYEKQEDATADLEKIAQAPFTVTSFTKRKARSILPDSSTLLQFR